MSARRRADGGLVVRDGAPLVTEPKRRYSRHGYHALRAKVKARGLAALDARTAGARALLGWRQDLYAALGGQNEVTPQQRIVIEGIVRQSLYVDHIDATLTSLPGGIAGRNRKAALPLLRERRALQDSISRMLGQIGLGRVAKPALTIQELAEQIAAEKQASDAAEATEAAS